MIDFDDPKQAALWVPTGAVRQALIEEERRVANQGEDIQNDYQFKPVTLGNLNTRLMELQAQVDALEELIVNRFVPKDVNQLASQRAKRLNEIKLG